MGTAEVLNLSQSWIGGMLMIQEDFDDLNTY